MATQYIGPVATGPNDLVTKALLDAAVSGVATGVTVLSPSDTIPVGTPAGLIVRIAS